MHTEAQGHGWFAAKKEAPSKRWGFFFIISI
jgi:hypothetical protein